MRGLAAELPACERAAAAAGAISVLRIVSRYFLFLRGDETGKEDARGCHFEADYDSTLHVGSQSNATGRMAWCNRGIEVCGRRAGEERVRSPSHAESRTIVPASAYDPTGIVADASHVLHDVTSPSWHVPSVATVNTAIAFPWTKDRPK